MDPKGEKKEKTKKTKIQGGEVVANRKEDYFIRQFNTGPREDKEFKGALL